MAQGTGTVRAARPIDTQEPENTAIEGPNERFESVTLLGRGSYGTVYKAFDRASGRIVALKSIPIEEDTDIRSIEAEISLLQSCDHPNIVKYLGSWHTNEALWIAMEYCGGGSISDLVHATGQPLTEQLVSYICGESLKGLAYLHSMGKLHRDIKCGNILLTETGEVKLADFGVAAQLTDTKSKRNTFIGTPHWMAPEVIQESRYDGKVDVWALGISAIEMAEVAPPRWNVHPMRVIFMISRDPPPSLSQSEKWSLTFNDFVAQCLHKDPRARPPAKHLLQHKFILRCPPGAQTQLGPLIAQAQRLAAVRGPLGADSWNESVQSPGPQGGPTPQAKGPWARTGAGWGRFAGLAIGGGAAGSRLQTTSQDSGQYNAAPASAASGTVVVEGADESETAEESYDAGTVRIRSGLGSDTVRINGPQYEDVAGGYSSTVAVHNVQRGADDYSAALMLANAEGETSYAAALAAVAAESQQGPATLSGPTRGGPGSTAALVDRLHALYMGESVIPLPFLRASAAAALALEPYPPEGPQQGPPGARGARGAPAGTAQDRLTEQWVSVLADVALESYSGAPRNKPDRAHAIPEAALEQVRRSEGLLDLLKVLAYHKRMLQEEVLTPSALERVQGQVNDMTDTLRTILCL